MKPIQGWDLINEAGEFKRLPPGIYGVKITSVKNNEEGQYFEITCDIVKGEYKDYFKAQVDAGLKDGSRTLRSYKTNALPFFKAFITAVEKSNPGYEWNKTWDEKTLVGKNVIAVFGEEEYKANDGSVKVATRIAEFRSLEAYQQGKITVPELKKLPPEETQPVVENNLLTDSDLPF